MRRLGAECSAASCWVLLCVNVSKIADLAALPGWERWVGYGDIVLGGRLRTKVLRLVVC